MRVGFLGPEGSFTHETAMQIVQERGWAEVDFVPCEGVEDVVNAVVAGGVHVGVVPVATSLGGVLAEAYAAIKSAQVRTLESIERTCSYHLLAVAGTSLEEVTAVLSHPAALADCRHNLSKLLPEAALIATASTGAAARRVAADGGRWQAGVAPASAAALYGLAVLASALEDDPQNRTTWAVIGPAT